MNLYLIGGRVFLESQVEKDGDGNIALPGALVGTAVDVVRLEISGAIATTIKAKGARPEKPAAPAPSGPPSFNTAATPELEAAAREARIAARKARQAARAQAEAARAEDNARRLAGAAADANKIARAAREVARDAAADAADAALG
jgi:hypothetical protein